MDSRTRKRYLAQVSAMTHLLQRHYSALPAGKSYADILSEGISAALVLGMVEVQHEGARQREMPAQVVEDAPRIAVYEYPIMKMMVPSLPGSSMYPAEWGLGMSLPRGDM